MLNKIMNQIRTSRLITLLILSIFLFPQSAFAMPHYLFLPFSDPAVKVQQGWLYTNMGAHSAMDYIKGTVDSSGDWETFDVRSAHNGLAKYFPSGSLTWGNYVLTKTTIAEEDYYNVYAHLEDSDISDSSWVSINVGDIVGNAGISGAANDVIHLHYEFSEDSYGPGYKKDAYDIENVRSYYPTYTNYAGCGGDYAFVVCPPVTPFVHLEQDDYSVEGANRNSHSMYLGTGTAGIFNKVTVKVRSYHNGTGPVIYSSMACYRNFSPGNSCNDLSAPWDGNSINSDNSCTLPNGNYSVTPYTGDCVFDFPDAPMAPDKWYAFHVYPASGSMMLMGKPSEWDQSDPWLSGLTVPGGSSYAHYIIVEHEE